MDSGVFFVFLVLSTVLVTNVAADWPLIDTMFLRYYIRDNNSHIDFNLKNARDIVPLLDKNHTTVFFIHGYLENVEWGSTKTVTTALLDYTSDNVCSLDYRQLAEVYPVSVEYVPHIAAALAAAINDMVEAGLNSNAIHCIGFSLGGQISGYTGRSVKERIARITGLDPAGPLFETVFLTERDAMFVDIIHTDMDYYGNGHISGTVDFKPNFGRRLQPGCITETARTLLPPNVCSHLRVYMYYAESIKNPSAFPSVKCNTDSDFKNRTCDTSSITPMGYHTPTNVSGVYYCQTNSYAPYSLGEQGTVYT